MCGIFAAINGNGSFNEEEINLFQNHLSCISHRGPDSTGFKTMSVLNNKDVFLGHKRLSIIDLDEEANQPMQVDHCTIIFNGEIFNYIELKEELVKSGVTFKTKSDTEVILKVYQKWGTKGFDKLNGMWAFIIVDQVTKKIIISRDRFSIKPLYYLNVKGNYYFASEIKQLLPFLEKKEINKEILYSFLNQGLLDYNNDTFFTQIKKIPPRHNLIINLSGYTFLYEKYWQFQPDACNEEKYAIEKFHELFYESIRLRLRSDVPIGSLLSGGLDSSAITLVANELSGHNFESFSMISKEKEFSEEKYIDLFLKKTGIKNTKVLFEPDMVLKDIDTVLSIQDEPFGSFSIIAQYNIFKQIKEATDIIVLLSGQGGDEALMGYNKYFFFNLKNKINRKRYFEAARQIFTSIIYRTVLTNIHWGHAGRYRMNNHKKYLLMNYPNINIGSGKDLIERQISDFERFSIPALAHYEDRNSMKFSLEVRHPFLDHRLVNFSLGVSEDLKIKNGWTKYLLRRSIDGLPKSIRWRRDKQGFTTPDEKWMKDDLRDLITNTFDRSILDEMGLIDSKSYLSHYNKFVKGDPRVYYNDLFRVYICELWAKKYMS